MPLEVYHERHLLGVADAFTSVHIPGASGLHVIFAEATGIAQLVHGNKSERRTLSAVIIPPGGENFFIAPTLILPTDEVEQVLKINLRRFD